MDYRKLGKSGLKLSELSFGSWITFGETLDIQGVKDCLKCAYECGVNFFDTAEAYGEGVAELLLGEALSEYRREDLVISTKIFWGGKGPNMTGLSWKHLVEGTKNSLRRLKMDYADILFCHRPDPSTPIEETVRAMDYLIKSGHAFYWGTSEWSAHDIERAYHISREIGAIPPSVEQPQYNLFHRERVEHEYAFLYDKYGIGLTTWSPLEFGILTGKYVNEIPEGSRLYNHSEFRKNLTQEKIAKVKQLIMVANEMGCTLPQLAIAWALKNQHVSSVIIGSSNVHQLAENLQSCYVKHQMSHEIMQKIEEIIQDRIEV